MTVPSTAEEKTCKKNDVKARSLLLMALPNEHQLTFDQCKQYYYINTVNPEVKSESPNPTTGDLIGVHGKEDIQGKLALMASHILRSVGHKEYQMGLLRTELEKVKQEKEGFEFKIAKFEKSAKDLDQLLASQITDKSKKGFCLKNSREPEVNEYGPRDSSLKPTTGCDKESDNSKENTDDSLKQQQKTDSKTSSARGFNASNSQLNDKGFVDSGCSRHMTGNIAYLLDFKDFDGGYVTFGGGAYGHC
ncbi:hypothetical protein Tco_1038065 [Tanacetum coccineum]